MRRRLLFTVLALTVGATLAADQARRRTTLDIYVVDVDGGKATLFVPPSGESVLIDAGHPGPRDADRIMAAVADAGLTQIHHLLLTHYHADHVGGVPDLAQRIPIGHYIDHGPSVEDREPVAGFEQAYAALHAKAGRTIVKAGDRLPIADLDWRIVTANGDALDTPLPGAGGRNAACALSGRRDVSSMPDENAHSIGSLITFGDFRALDLADLMWNEEAALMCPANRLGLVDLYLVSHHGLSASGSAALVHGVQPRVAVMQNGARKGAAPSTIQIIRTSPRLEDLWQLHWSYVAGIEQNSAGVFIANVEDQATLAHAMAMSGGARAQSDTVNHFASYWIKISASADGTFTVTNSRNQFSKTYVARE